MKNLKPNKEYWYSTCSHNIEFVYLRPKKI